MKRMKCIGGRGGGGKVKRTKYIVGRGQSEENEMYWGEGAN